MPGLGPTGEAAGRGAGQPLAAAGDWACAYGCALITLEGVLASDTIVRDIYRRLGYAEQTLKLAKRLRARERPATGIARRWQPCPVRLLSQPYFPAGRGSGIPAVVVLMSRPPEAGIRSLHV